MFDVSLQIIVITTLKKQDRVDFRHSSARNVTYIAPIHPKLHVPLHNLSTKNMKATVANLDLKKTLNTIKKIIRYENNLVIPIENQKFIMPSEILKRF